MTCTATIHVLGTATFTCELLGPLGHEVHTANLQSEKWASVSWVGDTAIIRPPGTGRRAS